MTTRNSVNTTLSGQTGTGNFVGSSSPTLTTPAVITQINDTNGNSILGITPTANAVNNFNIGNAESFTYPIFSVTGSDTDIGIIYITKGYASHSFEGGGNGAFVIQPIINAVNYIEIQNNTTGNAPIIESNGSDTNIILNLQGKGTGGVQVQGTGTNNNAASGYVGELVTSHITVGSGVSLTTNTAKDITSISLTAGDWDLTGNITVSPSIGIAAVYGWISTVSATMPDTSLIFAFNSATTTIGFSAPSMRVSIASTTTVYLSCEASFASGTCTGAGAIYARRAR